MVITSLEPSYSFHLLYNLIFFHFCVFTEQSWDTKEKELTKVTFTPSLMTFEEDIMNSMGIKDERKRAVKFYYWLITSCILYLAFVSSFILFKSHTFSFNNNSKKKKKSKQETEWYVIVSVFIKTSQIWMLTLLNLKFMQDFEVTHGLLQHNSESSYLCSSHILQVAKKICL